MSKGFNRDEVLTIMGRITRHVDARRAVPTLRLTQRRGHCIGPWHISVPKWALAAHPAYALYYITHEMIHALLNLSDGDAAFNRAEQKILRELFGLKITKRTRGGYVDELSSLYTGKVLCYRYGETKRKEL